MMANFLQCQETLKRTLKKQRDMLLLEKQHAESSQNLQERIESLKIQCQILQSSPKTSSSLHNEKLISLLLASQTEIHALFSQQLLRNQVEIHRQSQMTETIRKYEHKIAELGSILRSKQAQIADLQDEVNPQPKISRQHLRTFKNQALSKGTVKQQLNELRRLQMEVRDIEQEVMDYGRSRSRNNSGSFEDILQDFSHSFDNQNKLNSHQLSSPTKPKSSYFHKDALLMRSMQLYESQMLRQDEQMKELMRLEEQLQAVTEQNEFLCRRYNVLSREEDVSIEFQENPEDYYLWTINNFSVLENADKENMWFGANFLSEKDINSQYSSNSKSIHHKKLQNCNQRSERYLKQN